MAYPSLKVYLSLLFIPLLAHITYNTYVALSIYHLIADFFGLSTAFTAFDLTQFTYFIVVFSVVTGSLFYMTLTQLLTAYFLVRQRFIIRRFYHIALLVVIGILAMLILELSFFILRLGVIETFDFLNQAIVKAKHAINDTQTKGIERVFKFLPYLLLKHLFVVTILNGVMTAIAGYAVLPKQFE